MKTDTRALSVLLNPKAHEKLADLARKNNRSVSGEARHAIDLYLTKEK